MTATITLPRLVGTEWAANALITSADLGSARTVEVSARQVSTITQRFIFAFVGGLVDAGVTTVQLTGATAGLFEAFTDAAADRLRVIAPSGEPSYQGVLANLRQAAYDPAGGLRSDRETAEAVRRLLHQAGAAG